jgi:hypothetical protein
MLMEKGPFVHLVEHAPYRGEKAPVSTVNAGLPDFAPDGRANLPKLSRHERGGFSGVAWAVALSVEARAAAPGHDA